MPDVSTQTLTDLAGDLAELLYLAGSGNHKLAMFQELARRQANAYRPETTTLLTETIAPLARSYRELQQELETALAHQATWQTGDIPQLTVLKKRSADLLKTLHLVGGAVSTAAEWQSPSFLHAVMSQAGKHTGAISGNINDYQRDFHRDGRVYEHAFRSEYIDARWTPSVVVTNSGMAALTTVIAGLHIEGKLNGPVIVGKSSYFEYKEVLDEFCPGRVTYVDEMDTDAIVATVKRLQPSAIFLDSLCNVETIAVPDLPRLIPALANVTTRPTTLVIDNTGLGPSYQPLRDLPRGTDLGVVVLESLQKYHQFGFDGVTGGIVWRDHATKLHLFRARMHLGTNIADASVVALPSPNREMLTRRMARLHRNATYLAHTLDTHYRTKRHLMVSHVVYPGLPSHPAYAWTQHLPFHGSFLTLAFRSLARMPMVYQAWLHLVIHEAKKVGIDLVAGTSFGFNTTRIYLTARHANKSTTPFIRISAGTETQEDVEKLAAAIIRATDKMTL